MLTSSLVVMMKMMISGEEVLKSFMKLKQKHHIHYSIASCLFICLYLYKNRSVKTACCTLPDYFEVETSHFLESGLHLGVARQPVEAHLLISEVLGAGRHILLPFDKTRLAVYHCFHALC